MKGDRVVCLFALDQAQCEYAPAVNIASATELYKRSK